MLKAFREGGVRPTSNLIFLFDGEEEAGSPHLGEYLTRYRDRVSPIDIWLFFDGPVHQSGRPQITFGVRGSMGLEVTVYGATRELHSGHYGNWAPDTPLVLARLLASMKDDNGKVLVEGWYDSAAPIGPEERAALTAMPDYDAELKRELGLAWTEGQPASLPERLLLPALTVRGISGGNTGALAANVIPTTATAALGIRLVKGNDPAKMRDLIVRHIERQGFHVVTADPDMATRLKYPRIAKVTGGEDATPAARTSMANPFARQVVAAAGRAADRLAWAGGSAGQRASVSKESLLIAPGMGGTLPLYPVHRRRRQTRRHRAHRQPRQQPARRQREPAHRESLVRDRSGRGADDDRNAERDSCVRRLSLPARRRKQVRNSVREQHIRTVERGGDHDY